jgi:hypothetical protein
MRSSMKNRFFDWLHIRFAVSTEIDGLWIGAFTSRQDAEILQKVGEALQLIKTYDPYRYARVLKECNRILVVLLPGSAGLYRTDIRICMLDARYVLSYPLERLAAVIVHEATHGRLLRLNVGYSEEMRHRVEKVCARQELAFALKVPNGDDVRKSVALRSSMPATSWSDEAFKERRRKGEIATIRYAGIPDWLSQPLLAFRDRLSGRHS